MAQRLTIDNLIDGGFRDYTRNFMDASDYFESELNHPSLFRFTLQECGDADFVIPTRGSYVTFEDTRWESRDEAVPDYTLFTGYISDDPEPFFLGAKGGEQVLAYRCVATSDDYLPMIKELPARIYVNKTRGFIIRDLIERMFANTPIQPLDTGGVHDGGLERLFQTDRTMKFADLLAGFAKADGFRYRCVHGKLFYEPEAELLSNAVDPKVKLAIDRSDPRFTPSDLELQRVATTICNDVTVIGAEEPTTFMHERWISDGYQGEHRLIYKPYGVEESVLIQDDWTEPSFDTGLWDESDDPLATEDFGDGSYIQLFEGSLNIIGGSEPTNYENPPIYLRARKGVELAGILEFRDGEIFFPPSPSGVALVGALVTDESMALSSCFSGWWLNLDWNLLHPVINGQIPPDLISTGGILLNPLWHYVLRRKFAFDMPIGMPVIRRGPLETPITFGDIERANGCWVTYELEVIDATDPQNVIVNKQEVLRTRIEDVPEFVLYAPVINYNGHFVMNYTKIHRPQQAIVRVDGVEIPLGDFIDGGEATIVVEGEKAKLQWYALPTDGLEGNDASIPSPWIYWTLSDPTTFQMDTGISGGGYHMLSTSAHTLTAGPPKSQPNRGMAFDGTAGITGPLEGNDLLGMPVPFTLAAWVRTRQADGVVFSIHAGLAMMITNGRIAARLNTPESAMIGSRTVNDGLYHYVVWTYDGTNQAIYIDGVLDGGSQSDGDEPTVPPVIGERSYKDHEWTEWSVRYSSPGSFAATEGMSLYLMPVDPVTGKIDNYAFQQYRQAPFTAIDDETNQPILQAHETWAPRAVWNSFPGYTTYRLVIGDSIDFNPFTNISAGNYARYKDLTASDYIDSPLGSGLLEYTVDAGWTAWGADYKYDAGIGDGSGGGGGGGAIVGPSAWYLGYDFVHWSSLGHAVETWYAGDMAQVAIYNSALTPEQINKAYSYQVKRVTTIPQMGSVVDITYHRADEARARIRSLESIAREKAKFGDDGIRQMTILPEEIKPVPRTSEECQYLAQAFLLDRAFPRYEGGYSFDTGELDSTRLDLLPLPGDLIPCTVDLDNGDKIDTSLLVNRVRLENAGRGAYRLHLDFGPRNRYDEAQRRLMLARKSSLDAPEIKDQDAYIAEVLNSTGYSIPDDPQSVEVINVTPQTFTVNMNLILKSEPVGYGSGGGTEFNGTLPPGVVGYEVRLTDTGWGQGNYVARISSSVFTLNRGKRDRLYFIKPFNSQNVYSRHAALARVIHPLTNNMIAQDLDGDVHAERVRLFIPLTRNPDLGGWLVRKDDVNGAVLYFGDGIQHRSITSGATILIESNRATLTVPNTGATEYTFHVVTYNLINEQGPPVTFTATRAAPEV